MDQKQEPKKTLKLQVKKLEPKSAPAKCLASSPIIGAT